jgi:molecular chaperone HtpG
MESYTFKAEITELMNMIIHNFYSNKDIFLRELVSNASDALNKLRHQSLSNSELLGSFNQFDIRISLDKVNNVLTIEDTGIGMTKDDLVNNLGTIAKSGTKEFIKKLQSTESNNLIGQFGVGFYSAYLVADVVKVTTRHAESNETWVWTSSANGSFTVEQVENSDLVRGSRLQLYVKPDEVQYLEESKVTEIIKKHSAYITYPIMLQTSKQVEVPVQQTEQVSGQVSGQVSEQSTEQTAEQTTEQTEQQTDQATEQTEQQTDQATEQTEQQTDQATEQTEQQTDQATEQTEQPTVEDASDDDDKPDLSEPEQKTEMQTVTEWKKINSVPLWTKASSDITTEEHEDFYKSISNDYDTYCQVKHFKIEGNLEFTGLLYIPKRAPNEMFEKKKNNSIKLYVKKVLITDNCENLYPEWMGFVKGVVDSQDIPLNASRELLQQSKIIRQINKNLVKKTIEMMTDLTEDNEKYLEFYKNFNKNIKLGIHEDSTNREKLIDLLRYKTSSGDNVSLKQYVERMKESQKNVYYITGESLNAVENSPFIDKLKRLEYEIIYMIEPIDEYIIQHITEYDSKKLINVSKDDLALDDEKLDSEKYTSLCEKLKQVLSDKVDKVVVSNKIESQPAVVTNSMGISANMERLMKAQPLGNNNNMFMFNKKILEINPEHDVMKKISSLLDNDENVSTLVDLVYNCALLAGGFQVTDINDYLKNVYSHVSL